MDLSAFSNDDFDVKDWINATFRSSEAQENREAFASTLVQKLQLFIQEINNALEETAQQVVQNLPRVVREVEAMQQEAKLLQEQMLSFKEEVMKVEQDSSKSMQTLLYIDTVKSRMQEATQALREADNWTHLSSDVEEVFKSGDINAISDKLIGMQNSLELLVDVSDHQERCQYLEGLKNSLEAMLSPQLIAAFNAQSSDLAQVYVKIFRDIKRLPELLKYYHKCRKSQLLQEWNQTVQVDPEETVLDWMNSFYDLLLSTWHSQMAWCSQVFVDVPLVEILSDLFVDVLSSLDPSLLFCLEAALKQQPKALQFLITAKQITDRCSKSLELAISSTAPANLQTPHVSMLAQTLYSPLRPLTERYASLEERKLLVELSALTIKSEELSDSVRHLGESVNKVFHFAREALNNCNELSHGCCYPGLLKALKGFFSAYAEQFRMILGQLRYIKNQKTEGAYVDQWSIFQQALETLQIGGELVLQLGKLEQELQGSFKDVLKRITISDTLGIEPVMKRTNPFEAYEDTLLSPNTKRDLQELILKFKRDDSGLLLEDTSYLFKKLCHETSRLVFETAVDQVQVHLLDIPTQKMWASDKPSGGLTGELPSFSISPQEYITQIGQYLMTLPQHVEPFVLQENPALITALKHGNIPHTSENDVVEHVADYLLGCIARGTVEYYMEAILKIPQLTPHSTQQLITDIDYLCDVLEDLGLSPLEKFRDLLSLLKASPQEFSDVAHKKSAKLVVKIQTMRNIK